MSRTFAKTQAREIPTQACAGRVASLDAPRLSKQKFDAEGNPKPQYYNQPINIEGFGVANPQKAYFLYRPEWFTPGFNPETFYAEYEGGSALTRVYGNMIANSDQLSMLQGLCGGNDANFNTLADAILSLAEATNPVEEEEEFVEALAALLTQYLVEEGFGRLVVYTLKQQQEASGVDAEGKTIYQRSKFMSVDQWKRAGDEKAVEKTYNSLKTYCDRNPNKMVMSFELGDIPAEALTAAAA